MRNLLVLAVIGALTVAAAAGATADPRSLVLRLPDMPAGFTTASARYDTAADVAGSGPISAAQYRAWGYLTGYDADYKATGGLVDTLTGPVEIESHVSVYRDARGAAASFAASAALCTRPPFSPVAVGARLGDAARMCAYTETKGGVTGRVYVVIWRRGELKATVILAATRAGASPVETVKLAVLQDSRMRG